jgi:adenylate kinase
VKIILLGPPGAGKGTQAQFICSEFEIPQISTGDMLRSAVSAGTSLGNRVKAVMESGALVSDEIIIDLVKERIARDDCDNGFLFDGFPRTVVQAQALAEVGVSIDFVVEISVPDEEIVKRMGGRRVHPTSGRIYHIEFNPPKVVDVDDETGEPLVQRDDDHEITVRDRLAVYHEQTHPLIERYQQQANDSLLRYFAVDGRGSMQEIQEKILSKLRNK